MSPQTLFETLKTVLHSKGLTYKDLAAYLELSESGVKKMLAAKDLSVSRLSEICEWLDLSVRELMDLSAGHEAPAQSLTSEQVNALFNNHSLFRIFWRLNDQEGLLSVARGEKLSAAEMKKKLADLEALNLISVRADGRVRLRRRIRWSEQAAFTEKFQKAWGKEVLEASLKEEASAVASKLFRLSSLSLSESSQKDLRQSLQNLINEFEARSRREEILIPRDQLKPLSLMIAGTSERMIDLSMNSGIGANADEVSTS